MSAGNHSQGVAYSAKLMGIKSTIVMPDNTPFAKIRKTTDLGAEVIVIDRFESAGQVTKTDIASLSQALDMYKLDNHFYPTTDQGIDALVTKPNVSPLPRNWNSGGYIKGSKIPLDPWDGEYVYFSPGEDGQPYELFSLGADGRVGGSDYDADISSSSL